MACQHLELAYNNGLRMFIARGKGGLPLYLNIKFHYCTLKLTHVGKLPVHIYFLYMFLHNIAAYHLTIAVFLDTEIFCRSLSFILFHISVKTVDLWFWIRKITLHQKQSYISSYCSFQNWFICKGGITLFFSLYCPNTVKCSYVV